MNRTDLANVYEFVTVIRSSQTQLDRAAGTAAPNARSRRDVRVTRSGSPGRAPATVGVRE